MASSSQLPDQVEGSRIPFTTEHFDKLETRGSIRILNICPGPPDDLEVHCELIPGTILDYKERNEHDPPIKFVPYDALSWCWGTTGEDSWISIRKGGTRYAKAVKSDLVAALRALRHPRHDRPLWIDAVCIDQTNVEERNHQVEMMADIYGKADCVRVWLGNPTDSSNLAIAFIKKEVLQLQHFDELCESKEASAKWKSLLELMQRPWFSRRWVVQEVALAKKAIIHCGSAKISWNKFAVAVELFVEVETATHRLSEVMKKDPKYYHVPMWFEYVSALGASLLVDATGKLFRDYEYSQSLSKSRQRPIQKHKLLPNPEDDVSFESEDDELLEPEQRQKLCDKHDIKQHEKSKGNKLAPKGQPLLNLEYLVSSLSIFDVTKHHDTIYALLGIAKDTTPTAANKKLHVTDHTQAALEMFTEKKQYIVDYQAPYVDVCKEFIQFCVERSLHLDPSRALDVICRPWATEETPALKSADEMSLPSWVPQLSKASYGMDTKPGVEGMKMGRKNADALVGLPSLTQRNYNSAETKGLDRRTFRFRKRITKNVKSSGKTENAKKRMENRGNERNGARNGAEPEGAHQHNAKSSEHTNGIHFSSKPETDTKKQENKNEGSNDTSSGEMTPKINTKVEIVPKPELNHFSMYIKGFVLDKISEVQPSSQNGSIPSEWADFAGWTRMQGNPPDHFWRTLVADRGRDGKNPPVYYSRACKESFNKGSFQSGSVDTTGLINNERNSVVAQFCRRVQAAIWNRALIKTESGKLGLVAKNVQVGDLVCILYGCSVPVVLRRQGPKDPKVMDVEMEWELKYLADRVGASYKNHLARKELFRVKRERDSEIYKDWEQEKRDEWIKDKKWATSWEKARKELMLIHEFNSWAMEQKAKNTKSSEELNQMQEYINVSLTDKCRPSSPPEKQKKLWDEFNADKAWRDHWRQENYRFSTEDGFRVWLREKNKRAAYYPDEWKACRDEWWTKDSVWRSRWKSENSRYLCIDSFRAWLREKGIFSGSEKDVQNMQDWEKDTVWRNNWKRKNPKDTEQDEFHAWMRKAGRKNAIPQEVKTKEERSQFDDWSKDWRKEHKEATLDDEFDAWKVERASRAALVRDIHRLKSEAAKKQESEPFLERWRKNWRPPAVNWEEFRLALTYGRRWKQLVRHAKKLHLEGQRIAWSSSKEQMLRIKGRASALETMKERQAEAMREQDSRSSSKILWPVTVSRHKVEHQDGQNGVMSRRPSRIGHTQHGKQLAFDENNATSHLKSATDSDETQHGAEKSLDQRENNPEGHKGDPLETPYQESGSPGLQLGQRSIEQSSSMQSVNALDHSTKPALESRTQSENGDELKSRDTSNAKDENFKIRRTRTYKLAQEFQDELVEKIKSKEDLKERIEQKINEIPMLWNMSQKAIEERFKEWKTRTPRFIGRNGQKYYDCSLKRDGSKKNRERLNKEEQRIYYDRIVANFRASLGDDGRWWYQMFGECYLHGMMDGEAMAHQNNEGIPTTVFEIR